MNHKVILAAKAERKTFKSAEEYRAYRKALKEQEIKEQAENLFYSRWGDEEEMRRLSDYTKYGNI